MVLAGVCQISHLKHKIQFFSPEKKAEPVVLLYPMLRTSHSCCSADAVPCCTLWDMPWSLVVLRCICRESCIDMWLYDLLQQHASITDVWRLFWSARLIHRNPVLSCHLLPYSILLTNSHGLSFCPTLWCDMQGPAGWWLSVTHWPGGWGTARCWSSEEAEMEPGDSREHEGDQPPPLYGLVHALTWACFATGNIV